MNSYRTIYTKSRGRERVTAGEAYIEALVTGGDKLAASGNGTEAGALYNKAIAVASALRSERKTEIAGKIRSLASSIRKNKAFSDLNEKLKENPKDVKSRESLIKLYLLESDDSVNAAKLVTGDIDKSMQELLPLAAKYVLTVELDNSQKLAQWYKSMAKSESSPLRRGVAYRRAYDYYSVFRARHKKNDIQGLKAKIEQGDITRKFKAIKIAMPQRKTLKPEGPVVEIPSDIPVLSNAVKLNWKKEKETLTYTYSEMVFSKGGFDYSDHKCTKLLDGTAKTKWGAHSVGWSKLKPPLLVFKFARAVQPKAVRIHLFGKDSGGNVGMTKGIRIYTGSASAKGRVVGENLKIADATDWVVVPLKMSQSSGYFWIEFAMSDLMYVMLDEVEFE